MIIAAWHHLRSITHNLRLADELQASEQLLLEAQYIGRMNQSGQAKGPPMDPSGSDRFPGGNRKCRD